LKKDPAREDLMTRIWTTAKAVLLTLVLAGGVYSPTTLAQDKPNPIRKAAVPAAEDRQLLLGTVGLLAAGQLYQSYLNIGFVADAVAEGTYEEKEATQVLASVMNLLATTDKQMERIAKLELSKEDQAALDKLQKTAALVRQQGKALEAVWADNGDKAASQQYEKARKEAWQAVSKLLSTDN
jgi:hypothetical protein